MRPDIETRAAKIILAEIPDARITLSAKVAVADERLDDRVLVQDAGGADDHAGQVSGAAQCIRYTGRVSRR